MSATVIVHGTIRKTRTRTKRATGEVFGTEVSILTEVGDVLGETLPVLVFNARPGEVGPQITPGHAVTWLVDVESSSFGLNATFRGVLTPESLGELSPGALDSSSALADVPAF